MLKIAAMMYLLAAPVLMGVAVTALLTMDLHTSDGMGILWAALAGAVVALPVSWYVAWRLTHLKRRA